jgi:PKD repeat protein
VPRLRIAAIAAASLLAVVGAAHAVTTRSSAATTAQFTTSIANGKAPLAITVDATGSAGASYTWAFGDGQSGTGVTATHTYAGAGTYTVTLTVTGSDNQTATATNQVLAIGPGALTLATPTTPAPYGGAAAITGTLTPPVEGQKVRLEANRSGKWVVLAVATTVANGGFHALLRVRRPDTLRARWKGADGPFHTAESTPVKLAVKPTVHLDGAAATIYGAVTAGGSVAPSLPGKQVAVTITQGAKQIGQQQVKLGADSHFHFSVPAPGKGVYDVQVTVPASGSYAAGATSTKVHARFPELRPGMTEPAVGVLRRRLRALGYRSSIPGNEFSSDLEDAVLAFQKVQGLDRTGGVGAAFWSALDTPKLPHLRYPGQGDHLEVDKTLQVLLVAHAGKVVWISAVSTGGPGKYTPEGTFQVLRKVPGFDPSPLGTLWDPMYFTGGYAVHGNPSVPAYPASHGCVRVPMWVGSVLYASVPVGEPVDVYES